MSNQQELYDRFGSVFSQGDTAVRRGAWQERMQGGGDKLGQFSSQLGNSFSAPKAINGAEETSYADTQEAANQQQWGQGLNRVATGQGQMANLGFNAVSSKQSYLQAKEMAELQAQSADAQATQSMIGSGLSMLGSIGSFAKAGGFGGGGGGSRSSSFSLPASAQSRASTYGTRAFSGGVQGLGSSGFRYF